MITLLPGDIYVDTWGQRNETVERGNLRVVRAVFL